MEEGRKKVRERERNERERLCTGVAGLMSDFIPRLPSLVGFSRWEERLFRWVTADGRDGFSRTFLFPPSLLSPLGHGATISVVCV